VPLILQLPGVFVAVGSILLCVPIYLIAVHYQRERKLKSKMATIEKEKAEQVAKVEKLAVESPERLTAAQKLAFEGKKAWRDSMSSTSAASWNFATLARLEGGNASASSSLRGSITPVNSRPVTPEVIKIRTSIPPRVKSQHGSVHNSSISSTATMVDPGGLPPPAPPPSCMGSISLARRQVELGRTR
jgi:hypothetical protein